MFFTRKLLATVPFFFLTACAAPQDPAAAAAPASRPVVSSTNCNGKNYVYEELAGYGFVEDNARDRFGDTIGGIGSSIAVDRRQVVLRCFVESCMLTFLRTALGFAFQAIDTLDFSSHYRIEDGTPKAH